MNMIVGKIGSNLDSENGAVKKNTIKTLQFIGQGRPDVMLLLLPQLISGEVGSFMGFYAFALSDIRY